MPLVAVARFERFFRAVASLDVDKEDLRRYDDFVIRKLNDLLLRGRAIARANGRDVIQPYDLPITKGLQERIQEFKKLDEAHAVRPFLDDLTDWRPADLILSDDAEAALPDIAGGLSIAAARALKIVDPELKNPQTEQWERTFRLFDLLL
jgi:hypothetical protein